MVWSVDFLLSNLAFMSCCFISFIISNFYFFSVLAMIRNLVDLIKRTSENPILEI